MGKQIVVNVQIPQVKNKVGKYKAEDLIDWIEVQATIECSNCGKGDCYTDDEDYFFEMGWRATKNNVYCPECAKKKLKL